MRVSDGHKFSTIINRVERAKSQNQEVLDVLSSQKRINKISDDPVGVGKVVIERDKVDSVKQYQKNIQFSIGYLERTESAIQNISEKLMRAKDLAISMSNDTYAAGSREATSREIKQIMNEIISNANATYSNRYIFSGFRTGTPTLTHDGSYAGDDSADL